MLEPLLPIRENGLTNGCAEAGATTASNAAPTTAANSQRLHVTLIAFLRE